MSKAIGEIISGILTIIVLNILLAELAFAPIEVRESSVMGFIMWLFIFSIIWCFVNAVVNIVAAIITKTEPLKLAEINRRVGAIEEKIKNVQFAPSAAAYPAGIAAASAAPPRTDESVKKASKKTRGVVIAVVAIIIVAAIAAGLVLFAFNAPATPGAASPEQAFNSFLDRMNARDAAGVVAKTIWILGSNSSDYVTQVNQMLSQGVGSITLVSGPTVYTEQMMNASEQSAVAARVAAIESIYGVDITEFVVVAFTLTVSSPNGTMTITERTPAVLIDDLWYIDPEELFSRDGGDGDGDGGNQPIEVSISVNGPMGGNRTLIVTGVYNTSSLSTNDVFVEVKDSTSAVILSSRQLSSMISGDNYSGVVFNDNAMTSTLDVGDEFLLDEAIFAPSSELRLTNAAGDVTYADFFIA